MKDDVAARIAANPKYQQLKKTRASFSLVMTLLMMVVYYGYILLIAFNKEWLGTKIGEGMVTSVGIPMGLGVIVFTVILTNIYVRRANTEFDALTADIVSEEKRQ